MGEPWSGEGGERQGEGTPGQDSGRLWCGSTQQKGSQQRLGQGAQGSKNPDRRAGQVYGVLGEGDWLVNECNGKVRGGVGCKGTH